MTQVLRFVISVKITSGGSRQLTMMKMIAFRNFISSKFACMEAINNSLAINSLSYSRCHNTRIVALSGTSLLANSRQGLVILVTELSFQKTTTIRGTCVHQRKFQDLPETCKQVVIYMAYV
jgi:hypothetical protein